MRRFLVVGCGGSGGQTLAYLMDQLRSDLAPYGVGSLPQGWQFVHIDVPNTSDNGPDGLGNVEQQGGTYFGCGPQGASYAVLDDAVSRKFAETSAFDAIGTWAPRHPEEVNNPIGDGAGQFRAVGRMITLSRVSQIRQVLQVAWDRLNQPDTKSEMRRLQVPALGTYNDNTPIVLVVSSMAGGAGASMALDVCRLLTLVGGLNPRLMGVFMVAPNIFDAVPEAGRTGVRPNALAMLGEIVASQTGAAREHDVATLQALGQPGGQGVAIPFARVFPVGRFAGVDRTPFGDGSPKAVYRGLGRGLAGLIMSDTATTQFVSFDLGNTASPRGDRDLLGWGSNWNDLPWGSYGFASLSMGRDRYAEYSAQRIARTGVDLLLHGHLQSGSRASSNEQVAALLDSQWAGICHRAGLPSVEAEINGWMMSGHAFPDAVVDGESHGVVQRDLQTHVPSPNGLQAAQWVPALRQRLAQRSPDVTRAAEQAAVGLAFGWHRQLQENVEREVALCVARLGLPYGIAVVERLSRHLREILSPSAERLAAMPRPDVTAVPGRLEPTLGRLKGTITNGTQLTEELLTGCREQVRRHMYGRLAHLTARLLQQFSVDVLGPLGSALGEAQRILEHAMAAEVVDLGLARLATDQAAAWPADADVRVQSRFDEAENEVLLTSSTDFLPQYVSDVERAVDSARNVSFEDARTAVAGQVISGIWETTGGTRPPGGLLERRAQWRSRVFPTDPTNGQPIIPSHSTYDVHIRPAELLRRARMFVSRPGESFDQFCRLSITDFVKGTGAAESEIDGRRREVVEKFTEALALARPLISVNNTALQAVHQGQDIEYRYKFSEVPFKGLPIADDLTRVLTTNPMIDLPSSQNLAGAVGDTSGVTRVDIFGSYPNYSPLAFDAVLGPAAEQWAGTGDIGREAFWEWRRARPLAAALPMADEERRAMTAGWLLGQLIGHIRVPAKPYTSAVQIWDAQESRWVAFPHPLLTPPSRFVAEYDWLPAVLESVLLAVARSHEAPVMASLRPYRLLRGIYDDTSQGPASGINVGDLAARRLATEWLAGRSRSGGSSAVPGADAAATVDDRADTALRWLTGIGRLAGEHYMAPDRNGAPGGGAFSLVRTRVQASGTPLFHDVAPDVFWSAGQLVGIVEQAREDALRPAPSVLSRSFDTPRIVEDLPAIPQHGVF